jgi:hypothetical protein
MTLMACLKFVKMFRVTRIAIENTDRLKEDSGSRNRKRREIEATGV